MKVEQPLVAIVMDTSASFDREIIAGFAAGVTHAEFSCQRFTAPHGPEEWSHLQQALGEWLVELPRPVGVMACDDSRGRHVLEASRTQGLRVPHDVAVIGVDDTELICELAVPPIGLVPRASTDTLAVRDPAIAGVVQAIRDRACQGLSLEELVTLSGLARWKLEKQFKDMVGRSVHEDIVRVRLAEAQRLLRSTDLPLKAIAPRTGFHSVPYLITVFRRRFGITPARFRRIERDKTVASIDGSECDDDGDDIDGVTRIPGNPA